jgi:hypothetical protein
VGAVLPYAGPINDCTRTLLARRGWLFCDGSELTCVEYPELFRVIRRAYGWTDAHAGDAGWFCLPDLRGMFLRGVAGAALRCDETPRDPDAAERVSARCNGSGNRGDAVGSVQADAFQVHEHDYQHLVSQPTPTLCKEKPLADFVARDFTTTRIVAEPGQAAPRTSTETRPLNVYVNFVIKARRLYRPEPGEEEQWCPDAADEFEAARSTQQQPQQGGVA